VLVNNADSGRRRFRRDDWNHESEMMQVNMVALTT